MSSAWVFEPARFLEFGKKDLWLWGCYFCCFSGVFEGGFEKVRVS